ncbi:MAG: B12-binding domain-containing radical SAM protein [Promethearchaeota archaeon]
MRALIINGSREIHHVMVPPIGDVYLAAYLISQGHEVKLVDLALSRDFKRDISNAIDSFKPHLIGITIRNVDSATYPGVLYFYLSVRNVILYVKQIAEPNIPIVLGGAGFSMFSEEILRDLNHNLGVYGDGEYVIAEILKYIKDGRNLKKIERGICFIDKNGKYYQTPPWRVENLDDLPVPARQLLDNSSYLYHPVINGGESWGNIQTKRGCPMNCIYCSYKNIEGSSVRYRSPEMVADELDFIVNNIGIKNIFIVDSVLNLNYNHLKEICQQIIEYKIDINWGANYVPSKEYIDLMPLMKKSGAIHFATGFESLSEDMLKNLNKTGSPDDAILTSKKCVELGIEQLIHIMVGGPGETIQSIRVSLDRLTTIKNFKANLWQGEEDVLIFVGLRIYPNTQLNFIAEQEGVIPIGENLLKPKFYISPQINELDLFNLIREYSESNRKWMVPGLGINLPKGEAELSQMQLELYQK